ncbi:hypothetical protein ZIOFF_026855 [Zingiber officinale]|uniref:Endoglucanase n=1 Tax=Zingiber officinale TaxID=94328 RepID=A0A8J5H5D8_ZINOF|nr:hypothetical protein ZIOFF_026855 [Zingiber officinale]
MNHWDGTFEIGAEATTDDEQSRKMDLDRATLSRRQLDETQQSWLLAGPQESKKKDKDVDLGCLIVKPKLLKWILYAFLFSFVVSAVPITIAKPIPKHRKPPPDQYSQALHKALMFFNAQKSGRLPKNNRVPWRGDSALSDGSTLNDVKGGLVGGYYDAGDNIKFHFPMAFSMTLLSWSVVEYSDKYKDLGEYEHVRDLIKWGTDYLLKTFNSSATTIDRIYSQVGVATNGSTTPDDHYCWMRPEDMDYPRPVMIANSAPDLGGEVAAALAVASIVFHDDAAYSKKLLRGAAAMYKFARDPRRRTPYSRGNLATELFYNSTGYWDEYMWSAAWMYYASGNDSYARFATNPRLPKNAKAFMQIPNLGVFSWDNKLPGAQLLLTRLRLFLNPGYPYEETLSRYQNATGLNICMDLQRFNIFNYTPGDNPLKMSYVVGYGNKYPRHVHHRGASIPHNGVKYSCTGGYKWRDAKTDNPNTIIGAMVGGPDRNDHFPDVRTNYGYTEPTMAGNAGLVAALISLTTTTGSAGIDKNTIFSAVPPMYSASPPPPAP